MFFRKHPVFTEISRYVSTVHLKASHDQSTDNALYNQRENERYENRFFQG